MRTAQNLTINRLDEASGTIVTHKGVDAICLKPCDAIIDPRTTVVMQEAQTSGIEELLTIFMHQYYIDEQDQAWTSLDKFFGFERRPGMDFQSYLTQWEAKFSEAENDASLAMNEVAKCWLFWSRAGLNSRQLNDLRMKVNGDMTRWKDMIALWLKLSKSDEAAHHQSEGYRHMEPGYYGSYDEWNDYWTGDWNDEEYYGEDPWYEDGTDWDDDEWYDEDEEEYYGDDYGDEDEGQGDEEDEEAGTYKGGRRKGGKSKGKGKSKGGK